MRMQLLVTIGILISNIINGIFAYKRSRKQECRSMEIHIDSIIKSEPKIFFLILF